MTRIISLMIGWLIWFNLNGQNLEKHNWVNRILIVKAKDEKSKKFVDQLAEFSESTEELKDRKLVLYQIIGSKYKFIDFQNRATQKSGELSVNLVKEILNKQDHFEIILIGLDGSLKLQKSELLTKEELFKRIDSMPMRKAELKNRIRKN